MQDFLFTVNWRGISNHRSEHVTVAMIGQYSAMATLFTVYLSHIVHNPIYMAMKTRGLISLIVVAIATTHIAECGFIKLRTQYSTDNPPAQNCRTCLLREAGATRLILVEKTITKRKSIITFLTKGPIYFYSNVESSCAGKEKCGIMTIKDYKPSDGEMRALGENYQVNDNAPYLCLMKYKESHSLSCMSSLKDISGSGIMWNFLSHDPASYKSFHLYLLRTHKTLQEIVDIYRLGDACPGLTVALSKNVCDSVVKTVLSPDKSHVSPTSSASYPAVFQIRSRFGHHLNDDRIKIVQKYMNSIEKSLVLSTFCFRTEKVGGVGRKCLVCLSVTAKKAVVFMGRYFEGRELLVRETEDLYEMPYFYYIFSTENPELNGLFEECKATCGRMQFSGTTSACSALSNRHILSSHQHAPIIKRLENQLRKATTLSIQQPNLCIWVFSLTPKKCFQCLRQRMENKKLFTRLSRTTAFLRSGQMRAGECFGFPSSCFTIRDVPVDICKYEEGLMVPTKARTGLKRAFSFDLNIEPDPEIDHMSTLVQQHSPYLTSELTEEPLLNFGALTTVIHFNKNAKDIELNFFRCATCLVVHEEVLLVSVDRAHIWVTKEVKKAEEFVQCVKECSDSMQAEPRPEFQFDDYQQLQPVSVDDLVAIFCGDIEAEKWIDQDTMSESQSKEEERGASEKKALPTSTTVAYMDYTKCVSYLQTQSSDAAKSDGSQTLVVGEVLSRKKK